jgi:hypothetical protein
MLNEIALLLGAIGTGLLALDVVKAEILKSLRNIFAELASHRLSPSIIFKDDYDEKDHYAISVIKTVGFYTSSITALCLYLIYQPSDDLIQKIMYYPLSVMVMMLIGYFVMSISHKLGGWLISTGTYLALPTIWVFMFVFSVISWLFQLPIKFVVQQEEKWIGENQAPRVLGLFLLFLSFVLQFIAMKS